MVISFDVPTVDVVLRSPRAELFRAELDAALDAERSARQQFYDTIHEDDKAEFVNGEIIVQSPAKYRHTSTVYSLTKLLGLFVDVNKRGIVRTEKLLVALSRNDYEPDICYFADEKARLFEPNQMRFPAPDLIVEVLSPSTEALDRGVKLSDYAAHGVGEYWIIDPDTEMVEQYLLRDGSYVLNIKARSGDITSSVVEGFAIPIRAIFDADENFKAVRAIVT